ncbi:MAG: transposase [Nitrospirota bacterium]|nr:transposase [Nitrospirota bacterium]
MELILVSAIKPHTVEQLQAQVASLQNDLYLAQLKIRVLEEKLRQQRIKVFGPHSEKLSDLQLWLLEQEPSVSAEEVAAEAERPVIGQALPKREKKKHPGRQKLPEDLPRVVTEIPCSQQQCLCAACGKEMPVIGHDESEVLDVEPAKYFVRVTRREKRACKCERGKVVSPALAPRIIEKGLVSDAVVVAMVIGKYCDHLPLYRQESMLLREAGVAISRATMTGWMMEIGEMAQPVCGGIRLDLLAGGYIQADETTVDVQTHDKRGENHQAYLWQYGRPGGETVFDFQMGRGRAGPRKFLEGYQGKLQTDGYQAYDDGVGGPGMVHAGCWGHTRRGFVDAVKVNKDDGEAAMMVTRMDALFCIDRFAREEGMGFQQRLEHRKQHTPEWLDAIQDKCRELGPRVLPQSAMGKAIQYTLNQWEKLMVTINDGEIELSTNVAENSMRPVALGRKNWLHIGSPQAGAKVAAILTLVESCRRLRIPVKDYLCDILPGLRNRPTSHAAQLTPARWAASRA